MIGAKTVLNIHDMVIAREGGLPGDHGLGAVEGVLGRVINRILYEGLDDVYEIAAMYAVAIARGHVFNDANKRTALLTALTYLEMNEIEVPRCAELEEVMVDVAQGVIEQKILARIFYALAER